MDLKNFFKPTMAKIILFILLFIIFTPFIYYDTGIRCIQAPCPSGAIGSLLIYFLFSYNFYIYYILYINLIIGLLASYILSSALIYLIKKLKEK